MTTDNGGHEESGDWLSCVSTQHTEKKRQRRKRGEPASGTTVNCAVSAKANLVSLGNNASGDLGGCSLSRLASDLTSVSAELEPLATEPNPLPTRRPKAGSPLADAFIDSSCLPTDARGLTRPADGNDDGIVACDIGAVERLPTILFRDDCER